MLIILYKSVATGVVSFNFTIRNSICGGNGMKKKNTAPSMEQWAKLYGVYASFERKNQSEF